MALLSPDRLHLLDAAVRALVSPLAQPDVDAWRMHCLHAYCAFLGTSGGTFYHPDGAATIISIGTSADYARRTAEYTEATWLGTGTSQDPILDEFHAKLLRHRVHIWSMASADRELLGGQHRAWSSIFYNEVLAREKAGDTHALFLPTPRGSIMLAAHTFHRPPDDDEHFPVLHLLHTALVAGQGVLDRFHAHRAALEAVDEPLAAFNADGIEAHRNGSLARLLAADPEAPHIEAALAAFARRVRPLAYRRRTDTLAPTLPSAEVRTGRAVYALRAALLPPGAVGESEAFLVAVEARGVALALPSPEAVRERTGLTRREAEVAVLVAEGLMNEAIAERLFVSPHTVRHHVEAVMAKLELTGRGRAAVAARLLSVG